MGGAVIRKAAVSTSKARIPLPWPFLSRPTREGRTFPLPELKEPADAVKAMDAIADALRAGELTQAETLALVKVVEAFTAAIHVSNIDKRITAIEGKSK